MAETVMGFFGDEFKAYFRVDVAGFYEDTVGPEQKFLVATASSEANTLLDKAALRMTRLKWPARE